MKVYLHVHRGDRPGKCYWVVAVEGHTKVFGLHPDFGHAEPVDEKDVPEVAAMLCAQFEVYMEFFGVPVSQPDKIPDSIRELIRLD